MNEALATFEDLTGLDPRVVLLPTVLFDRLAAEHRLIDSVTPDTLRPRYPEANVAGESVAEADLSAGRWIDVRVVDSPRSEIEVY